MDSCEISVLVSHRWDPCSRLSPSSCFFGQRGTTELHRHTTQVIAFKTEAHPAARSLIRDMRYRYCEMYIDASKKSTHRGVTVRFRSWVPYLEWLPHPSFPGGHNSINFSQLPHDIPLHHGFHGCVVSVELLIGNSLISLVGGGSSTGASDARGAPASYAVAGRSVGQCETTICTPNSCDHGICLQHGPAFV